MFERLTFIVNVEKKNMMKYSTDGNLGAAEIVMSGETPEVREIFLF